MRQAVRGEFAVAMESLTMERGALMNQLSEVRLKLAEVQSEREADQKLWKAQADEEAAKIHTRFVCFSMCLRLTLFFLSDFSQM